MIYSSFSFVFRGSRYLFVSNGRKTILDGKSIGNQYVPYIRVKSPSFSTKAVQSDYDMRLGHVSNKTIRAIYNDNLTERFEITFSEQNDCD